MEADLYGNGRWTGRSGEKRFSTLCSDSHVVCNPSDEDERGWDFYIQYPERASAVLTLDEQDAAPSAVVQVKTTRGEIHNWTLSLRNAVHLVRNPLPAFILVYVMGDNGTTEVHGIHLWQQEIHRILLAARQADVEGDRRLNRRTITFPFDDSTRRLDPLDWIRSEIESVGRSYGARKEALRNVIGYDEHRATFTMTVRAADEERFMDMQLGLVEGIDVLSASITTRRFGIEAARPRMFVTGGHVEMTPTSRDARLRMRFANGDSRSIPAKVLFASGHSAQRFKVRVIAGCMELVFDDRGRISTSANLPYDQIAQLEDIELFAFLQTSESADPILLALSSDETRMDLGSMRITSRKRNVEAWRMIRNGAGALRRIAEYHDAKPMETSLETLDAMSGPLFVLDALVTSRELRLEFDPIADEHEVFNLYLAYGSVLVEGQVIGVVVSRPVAHDEMISDRRRRIILGAAKLLHTVHGEPEARLREYYLDEVDRLAGCHALLATGDVMRLLDESPGRELILDQPRDLDGQSDGSGHA